MCSKAPSFHVRTLSHFIGARTGKKWHFPGNYTPTPTFTPQHPHPTAVWAWWFGPLIALLLSSVPSALQPSKAQSSHTDERMLGSGTPGFTQGIYCFVGCVCSCLFLLLRLFTTGHLAAVSLKQNGLLEQMMVRMLTIPWVYIHIAPFFPDVWHVFTYLSLLSLQHSCELSQGKNLDSWVSSISSRKFMRHSSES